MRRTPALLITLCATVLLGNTCSRSSRAPTLEPRPAATRVASPDVSKRAPVYDKGLTGGWQDYGWAPRELRDGEPARVDFTNYGGWIIYNGRLTERGSSLVYRFKAPDDHGEFLEVRLGDAKEHEYPRVKVTPRHRRKMAGGWEEVILSMAELNPEGLPWDRVILRAHRSVPAGFVQLDGIALLGASPAKVASAKLAAATPAGPAVAGSFIVRCGDVLGRVSPGVYGIAFVPRLDAKDTHQWELGATARRWGGNPSERFNHKLGNAWNTGSDWFFMNLNYTDDPTWTWRQFLDDNQRKGVGTALTLPMIGWAAKDTESYSFPVDSFGAQQRTNPSQPNAGNGASASGEPLPPGPATRTSVAVDAAFVAEWVTEIEKRKTQKKGGVDLYMLGNEPMLWNSTHRDVFPEPLGYDELLARTIRFGTAVRKADPNARIAAPGLWGWPAYFYSAQDAATSFRLRPDRRRHGDEPLLSWYLKRLKAHADKTGVKLLDAVDVHFYPQTGVFNERVDAATAAKRIRSVRALWDGGYTDESWIGETIRLLPRMREIIDESWPGLDLVIGEYSFGGEEHMSGALALAEALGQMGRHGVSDAYYWTYPKANSPAFWAFRAFTNYDGKGAAFGDEALGGDAPKDASVFASYADGRKRLVSVLLNTDVARAMDAAVTFEGCAALGAARAFTLDEVSGRLAEAKAFAEKGAALVTLPPYSVTVLEVALEPAE